ncbi:dermonecrotic toxin domain-containing protein [Pseudomonas sp. 6D_7.1_Bac1]|uniref:dermonecrotic toxin domain-containing protein n=1 Tax=Pseudomonas sp. 6D_7.1_Bac1 TaxID=2971615 RepID=UPI0021CABDF4|nr:DUF6543 domain-containing protein [Pseudomonas sp. 6D_7.1_Bac1]MCU1749580.1 hypothetical protein [Pseudomonas sp. 6D_7.1_Bac1]
MIDRQNNEHPIAITDFSLAPLTLSQTLDEGLYLTASTRWHDSRKRMLELMTATLGVRAAITQLLKQRWNLDGDRVGLLFFATQDRSTRRASLAEVCAFMLQHPNLDTSLTPPSQVTGISQGHPFFSTPTVQLLEQLKTLDLKPFLRERWADYWNARAPGTALSRHDLAAQLYRSHFEAAGQLAFAEGALSAEQLKPLLAIIDPPAGERQVAGQRIHAEQLALKRSDGSTAELAGALVISLDGAPPASQLLYLPASQPALKMFTQRTEMESWLIEHQQQLFHVARTDAHSVIDYTRQGAPLDAGITQLLLQRHNAQIESVFNGNGGDIAERSAYALNNADQLDRQRRENPVFAEPPTLPAEVVVDGEASDAFTPFGLLNPDIPFGTRMSSLAQQRTAIETLLGQDDQDDQNAPHLQTLKQQLDALTATEQASNTAASALLDSSNPLQMLELRHTSNEHYNALYHARLTGLRCEADLQLTLNQISAQEHRMLNTLLETPTPTDPHPDVVAARLTLSATDDTNASTTTQTQELDGVLLFTHPSALHADTSHSFLLYWPGRFGGLQRFASRRELEQTLFKLPANNTAQALHLSALTSDPFAYALQNQLYTCEQQAARLIADNPLPSRAQQRAAELEKLREHTLARLTVPIPAARELAYAQIVEQNHSSTLAQSLPQWLTALSNDQRSRLKNMFSTYVAAIKHSHELLERDLPPRDDFCKKRIDARLRLDFSLKQGVEVMLDLPDSTTWRKVVIEGAAPGTPQENILIASQNRSRQSLIELALGNIDQALWWRLSFMQVQISADDQTERRTLETGVTQAYLRKLVTELDLAGQYEKLIRQAFFGSSDASAFSNEHRRECLTEPWRLMLKLQGEFALLKRDIDANGQQVLDIAIDANSREAYEANGKCIVLLPAHLNVGGADTDNEGPSTLTGVTFIEEQISGLTLLYLPDSPDGLFLRQYDNLEQARRSLFNLCLSTTMVNYLAGRALKGDFASHVSRINQAQLKNFDALIGTGLAWPATTSLAAHLLDVHMGRLLEAHRSTSRSNDALYLEHCALKSGAMFNYLKMALGMVPFVGTGIALYDAWGSANLAVAAFLRGDVGHGLAEVESVLLSLIDATMDILPGAVATPSAARALTRQRQWGALAKRAGALQTSSRRQALRTVERFAGYEYQHEISLTGLQPETQGIYRNVYRHADGDFMISQGRIYQIELSDQPARWRLSGTRTCTYKQPIALDEAGNWNTHYAVYGTLIEGGGAGGGAVLGHLADGMDPIWPAAIRRWLPRWWTDRTLRRQLTLTNTVDAYTRRLETQTRSTNIILERYYNSDQSQGKALQASLDAACVNDIDIAQSHYQNLEELLPLSHGRKRNQIEDLKSRSAWVVVDRTLRRFSVARERLLEHLDQIDNLIARSDTTPIEELGTHLRLLEQRKQVRKAVLREFDNAYDAADQVSFWNRRITNRVQKSKVAADVAKLTESFNEANRYYLKTAHILEIISRYDAVEDMSWVYFHVQLKQARIKVGRALFTQHNLAQVRASMTQRNKVLEDCLTLYAEFRRHLNAWTLGYPQHLDLEQITPFLDHLAKVEDFARHAIKSRASVAPTEGGTGKKLFETEDNQLLIGVESIDANTQQKRFTIEGIDGHTETWLPRSSGKYHLSEPSAPSQPPQQTDIQPLLAEARKRLGAVAAYKSKVEGYARQDMLPVDLEHMMSSEAAELSMRAQAIERLSPTDPVVLQLGEQARELARSGRTLRIDQSMKSKTPTEGYLDYLLEQQVVDIRKEGGLRDLGKRPDGRRDFLQEYEVRDLTHQPAQTLWYAHFHYTSAKPAFNDFVKGHLKLPEQRNLGLQWQQAQASSGAQVESIWRGDIGKPLGIKHFSQL